MAAEPRQQILQLEHGGLRFRPVPPASDKKCRVVLDGETETVFVVNMLDGRSLVQVQAITPQGDFQFNLTAMQGAPIKSLRFDDSRSVLAVKRGQSKLHITNISASMHSNQFPVNLKDKASNIKDFFWLKNNFFVAVTAKGFEHLQVNTTHNTVKSLKVLKGMNVSQVYFLKESQIIVLESQVPPSLVLQAFAFEGASFKRLGRADMELPSGGAGPQSKEQRFVCTLYNRSYVAVHTDQGKATPGSTKAYIYLHNLEDPSLRIEHVLGLDVNGNVMHNVVDNLLIIHHQVSAVRDHVCLNHSTNRVAVSSLSAAAAALGSIVHCLTCISGLFLPCHFFFFFERAPL
eukprot:m.151269 g.151269  ORF g.151269 m.151269 type:complete len:346 (+) comp14247_c0_seq7:902-1939(+)